ncbi:YaaR family protein [Clostridium sartagoforme]|uniref:YaaR family protein n=1 Tax=Clostridium sartagoforme TaxID=84031 RepID=UPI0031E105A9
MEIGRINRKAPVKQDTKVISEKRDFSQSFNQARERKSEEQLKEMIENIHKKGNRLVITKTYGDVIAYKKLIKEYLESILKFMYDTKKDISFWQTQYFITIDTIDKKLEDLTKSLLNGEGENLNIASSIDEIQGLIVDIYR